MWCRRMPDHHVWSGIPRDAGVGRTRHHYGNTEAGRLSDATTRRRRTERADTADVTATPPSARQEHFASDLRSRWSGPGGHGRGVPSMSSACGAAVLRLCLQPPAADWHKDTAKGLLLPGCLASVVAPVAMAVGPVTVIVASISIRVMMTLIVVDEVGRAFRHDRRYCSRHHRSGRGLGGHPLEHSGQTQSC